MGNKLHCTVREKDFLEVGKVWDDDDIYIEGKNKEKAFDIFLSRENAIQLIKDIKQAYDDAEIPLTEDEA